MARRDAHQTVQTLITRHNGAFRSSLFHGKLADLAGSGWVWVVTFGGASRKLPPHGAFEGFVDPVTGKLAVAIHHPEG